MRLQHLFSRAGIAYLATASILPAAEPIIEQLDLDPVVSDVPIIGIVGDSTFPAQWAVLTALPIRF